ncbi:MAG: hypothetical protein CML98_08335 [Rhodobiaceae bacterium]|nr:hypothetical protein [Rhodobiaceae bacterium]|tara:strand:+ start:3056 stop:3565 length:510 start_codon:yes stop_codon:yes gene_type:complete
MKYKKRFNRKDAHQIIESLMNEHNIKLKKWSVTSCGRAYFKQREIKIPRPNNLDRFFVCLHEIKHIIDQRIKPSCLAEFRCDKYALDFCNDLGWKSEMVKARMDWHSLSRLAMATNRGLKEIPLSIQIFYSYLDLNKWVGRKVYVSPSRHPSYTRRDVEWWKLNINISD